MVSPAELRLIPEHWRTIAPLLDKTLFSSWVTGVEQYRLAAYDAYQSIYWTDPDSFKVTLRGQEGTPIYIPSGRKVVEIAQRYCANDLTMVPDPAFGSDAEIAAGMAVLTDLLRRERFYSKFASNKRDGLKKGDWIWHLVGDPDRVAGARVSVVALDPSVYFPEYSAEEEGVVIAAHLVEPTISGGKVAVRRLTYSKDTGLGGPSPISVFDAAFPPDEWGQPGTDMGLASPLEVFTDQTPLPSPIDALPVYHIPNMAEGGFLWGSSEMRGIERLMTGLNQGITDEELTLILEGLGIYVTDAGAPVDPNSGERIPWNLGPARVVELPKDKTFTRVNSSGTIQPYQDHLKYLHGQIDDATGTNDVTRGSVDVAVAESGIALRLRMDPLLARMREKELVVTDVLSNMFFGLRNWLAAYEGINVQNIRWMPSYGPKIPVNQKERFDELMAMATSAVPVVSGQEVRRQLVSMGWTFTADDTEMMTEILSEHEAFNAVVANAGLPAATAPAPATGPTGA